MKAAIRNRAARLYALAMVAHTDLGGAASEEQEGVIEHAHTKARADLERMGYDYGALGSLQACIDAAKAEFGKTQ